MIEGRVFCFWVKTLVFFLQPLPDRSCDPSIHLRSGFQ